MSEADSYQPNAFNQYGSPRNEQTAPNYPSYSPAAPGSPAAPSNYAQPTPAANQSPAGGYEQAPASYGPAPQGYGQQTTLPGYAPSVNGSYGQYGAAQAQASQFQAGYRTVIPLRPLGVGDSLDAIFRLLKFNPAAYFLFPLIVTMATSLVSSLISLLMGELTISAAQENLLNSLVLFSGPAVLIEIVLYLGASVATTVVGTRVTIASVRGHKVSLKDAFRFIKPNFWKITWRLLGYYLLLLLAMTALGIVFAAIFTLTLGAGAFEMLSSSDTAQLGGAIGVVIGIILLLFVALVALMLLYIRLALAPCVIVAEEAGPITAIKRSWALTKGSFWYLLGTILVVLILVSMVTGVFSSILVFITILIGLASFSQAAIVASTILSSVLTAAIISAVTVPIDTALINLLYVNMRFKRENFHLQLIDLAQAEGTLQGFAAPAAPAAPPAQSWQPLAPQEPWQPQSTNTSQPEGR